MQNRITYIILKIGFIGILVGAFLYLYYTYNPSYAGAFPKCPTYTLLHIYCPGCGSQRAIHQLLHFNIVGAFRYNPLLVILLPLVLYGGVVWLYNFIFSKNLRIPIMGNNYFVYTLLVVVLVYWVLRNVDLPILDFLKPEE